LTIKNLPKEIHDRLKERARLHRRSMNSEAILCLERSVGHGRPSLEEKLASLERLHQSLKHLQPLDDEFLDQAKNQRRP
jgi:plasmid stability protein